MKHFELFNSGRSLLTRLTLFLALILGATSAWADTTLFGGSVASGWTYTNSAGTTKSVTSSQLYDGGSYMTPSYYTSTYNVSISSGQTIQITTKKASSSYTPSIIVYYSSDNGSNWEVAKEFNGTNITSTTITDDVVVDNIEGSYYLKFELGAVYVSSIIIKDFDPYPTPTDFALVSFTESSATFSWSAGNSETAWQFAYSTSSSFTPGTDGTTLDITDNPYTITGLTEGTTYYAAIRASYGGDNYSEWTEKIEFTPSNVVEKTINDGSSNLYYLPFYYGGVAPSSGDLYKSQYIIPKGSLDFATGRQINKLVFYASTASKSFGNAEFEVYLKETDNNSFSSNAFESWGTCVANSAKLVVNSDKEMVVELNTPFNYSGNKNLMIGFKQTVKGSNSSSFTWVGVSATNAGYYYYGTYGNRYSYLPKITITTVPATTAPVQIASNGYTTFASAWPLDLTIANLPSGLEAYKASEVDVANSKVRFSIIDDEVQANTGILLKGTAGKTYNISVVGSGTDISESNAFLVNSTGGTFSKESGYTYFALKKDNPLTFATFDPSSVAIPSSKAYLKISDAALVKGLTFVFDEETAIENVTEKASAVRRSVYDLSGRRLTNDGKLKSGLYIVGGKKVVIK